MECGILVVQMRINKLWSIERHVMKILSSQAGLVLESFRHGDSFRQHLMNNCLTLGRQPWRPPNGRKPSVCIGNFVKRGFSALFSPVLTWCLAVNLFLAFAGTLGAAQKVDDWVVENVTSRQTIDDKRTFLLSVIAHSPSEPWDNLRKATALVLLGTIMGTNAIPDLVANIDFMDTNDVTFPASSALRYMGDAAVPALLDAARQFPNKDVDLRSAEGRRVVRIVDTLCDIKGRGYFDFIEREKAKLPPHVYDILKRFASISA
jgi:hypothetical protein